MCKHFRSFALFPLFITILFLSGCGEEARIEEQLNRAEKQAQISLERLRSALDQGQVRNATILKNYSEFIANNIEQYRSLAVQLGQDASPSGPLFTNLTRRLDDAAKYPEVFNNWQERYLELKSLSEASNVAVFSDALSDPVNVLADMSGGQLPRVNAVSMSAETAQGVDGSQVGKQLVGNPSYGSWRSDSSGRSFWEWYGMYSLFSNFMPSRRYHYDSWSSRRGYSYYNDVGRSSFTSPRQNKLQVAADKNAKFQARRSGRPYTSPYSKQRSGASGLSKYSRSLNTKSYASRYSGLSSSKSSYSKKSTTSSFGGNRSSYGSSSRSSYSQRSRGLSLGK